MTDNELLLAISDMIDKKIEPVTAAIKVMQSDIDAIKSDIVVMKSDIVAMKSDIVAMQNDIDAMKRCMAVMQSDIDAINQKVTSLELKLENETNHNIQLLAENHINLVDKLNQAIRVSDKTLLYEVQVSTLKSKVEYLEKEVAEIKNHIA